MRLEHFGSRHATAGGRARWLAAMRGLRSVDESRRRRGDHRRGARAAATTPCELTERFDKAELGPEQLRVDPAELEASVAGLEPDVLGGLRTARSRTCAPSRRRSLRRARDRWSSPEGQTVEVVEVPVRRAGVYVPGGRAAYPSTVVMCA